MTRCRRPAALWRRMTGRAGYSRRWPAKTAPNTDLARSRAAILGWPVELRRADAHARPFGDAIIRHGRLRVHPCSIPDKRATRGDDPGAAPGRATAAADHVAGAGRASRALRWVIERVSVPVLGERLRRRPLPPVQAAGLDVEQVDRLAPGVCSVWSPADPPVCERADLLVWVDGPPKLT